MSWWPLSSRSRRCYSPPRTDTTRERDQQATGLLAPNLHRGFVPGPRVLLDETDLGENRQGPAGPMQVGSHQVGLGQGHLEVVD